MNKSSNLNKFIKTKNLNTPYKDKAQHRNTKPTQIKNIKNKKIKKKQHIESSGKCSNQEILSVRLNLINHLVGFIPCQICLYFNN